MRMLRWTLPALALVLCVASAEATPITYTVTGTATGALGASAFTNALVTVTLVGPEPASMLLLGAGLAACGARRWRKKDAR